MILIFGGISGIQWFMADWQHFMVTINFRFHFVSQVIVRIIIVDFNRHLLYRFQVKFLGACWLSFSRVQPWVRCFLNVVLVWIYHSPVCLTTFQAPVVRSAPQSIQKIVRGVFILHLDTGKPFVLDLSETLETLFVHVIVQSWGVLFWRRGIFPGNKCIEFRVNFVSLNALTWSTWVHLLKLTLTPTDIQQVFSPLNIFRLLKLIFFRQPSRGIPIIRPKRTNVRQSLRWVNFIQPLNNHPLIF